MTRAAARAAARGDEGGTGPGPRAGSPTPTVPPVHQQVQQLEQQQHQQQQTLQQRQSMVRLLRHELGLSPEDDTPDVGEALAHAALMASLYVAKGSEPHTASEALSGKHAVDWHASIDREKQAMTDFGVWDPKLV